MEGVPGGGDIRRPTYVTVDLGRLAANYKAIRARVPADVRIMAVVKADAYHHGAAAVARTLERLGVDYLAVALVEEGIALRAAGVTRPVVLLSGPYGLPPRELARLRLQPVVFDLATLAWLTAGADVPIPVHIEIDTGMTRLGFRPAEIPVLLQMLGAGDRLRVAGLMTHFACADDDPDPKTPVQIDAFRRVVEQFRRAGIAPALLHAANSAGLVRFPGVGTMVRPGILLYGVEPRPGLGADWGVEPVMRLRTAVLQVKAVPAGTTVSYGATFATTRPSRIAVLPIGYADGLPLAMSNRGHVLIGGTRAPIVGRVCMDMTMVDITDVPGDVRPGDEVVIIGRQGDATVGAHDVARTIGTIPYEVLCALSSRVPRMYVDPAADDFDA